MYVYLYRQRLHCSFTCMTVVLFWHNMSTILAGFNLTLSGTHRSVAPVAMAMNISTTLGSKVSGDA